MFRLCSEQTIQSSTSLWTPQHPDIHRGNNIVIITSVVGDSSSRDDYASCFKFREDVQPAGTKCGFMTVSRLRSPCPQAAHPSMSMECDNQHIRKNKYFQPRVDFRLISRRDRAGWTDIFLPHLLLFLCRPSE